jgi:hypothetical protein
MCALLVPVDAIEITSASNVESSCLSKGSEQVRVRARRKRPVCEQVSDSLLQGALRNADLFPKLA